MRLGRALDLVKRVGVNQGLEHLTGIHCRARVVEAVPRPGSRIIHAHNHVLRCGPANKGRDVGDKLLKRRI